MTTTTDVAAYWERLDVPDTKGVCGHWLSQHGGLDDVTSCRAGQSTLTAPKGTF